MLVSHVGVSGAWLAFDQVTHANRDWSVLGLLAYALVYYGLFVALPLTLISAVVTVVVSWFSKHATGEAGAWAPMCGLISGPAVAIVAVLMTEDDEPGFYVVALAIFAFISLMVHSTRRRRIARHYQPVRADFRARSLLAFGVVLASRSRIKPHRRQDGAAQSFR
jgi:MFS family permease